MQPAPLRYLSNNFQIEEVNEREEAFDALCYLNFSGPNLHLNRRNFQRAQTVDGLYHCKYPSRLRFKEIDWRAQKLAARKFWDVQLVSGEMCRVADAVTIPVSSVIST